MLHCMDAHSTLPVPDPTLLTTQQILREIAALKDVVFTRLDGMDRAIVVFNDNITRVPTDTDKQIARLHELIMQRFSVDLERFNSVQTQFLERDVRVEQTARDTKVAVDAALMAAEKAVGKQTEAFSQSIAKSEGATTKQIDQLGTLVQAATLALNDKIDDMKARIGRIEGQDVGQKTAVTTQQTANSSTVSVLSLVIGSLIGAAGVVVAIVSKL